MCPSAHLDSTSFPCLPSEGYSNSSGYLPLGVMWKKWPMTVLLHWENGLQWEDIQNSYDTFFSSGRSGAYRGEDKDADTS